MSVEQLIRRGSFVLLLLFLWVAAGICAIEDNFGSARKTEGEHFSIYFAPKVDSGSLAQRLNLSFSDRFLAGAGGEPSKGFAEAELNSIFDALFLRICDILEMRLYSFKGNIKICSDYQHLKRVYNYLFNREIAPPAYSFYVYELNTVYISAEYFTLGILAHEIAHAIISHYFVVQPSVKIQEILAGYAEYQMRKAAK